MRQVLCPIVVGRGEELELLAEAVAAAGEGRGGAVLLLGEAGIGKSRLVRESVALARRQGLSVLVGRAVDSAMPAPFRPLTEALMSAVRRHGLPQAADLEPFRAALGRLVPEWRRAGEAAADDSAVMLGEAVLRLLHVLGAADGCLLVLEDLHWADAETLAVVEYLADNAPSESLLLVMTARTGEDSSVERLGRSLQARGAATLVPLSPLTPPDVERMAQATLEAPELTEDVRRLVGSWAEGIPLLVEDLLAELIGTGVMARGDTGWVLERPTGSVLPSGFRHATRQRLARLGAEVRYLLAAAAVLGGRFDASLLSLVTGVSEPQVLDQLRASVAAQLVTADEDGVRFRHALTRDAVLASLLPPERAALAGRALEAVRQVHPGLPGGWCELAAELAQCAGDGPAAATLLLESARRALARGALATAEDMLERSRRLAEDPSLRADIEETLVEVVALAGKADRALEVGSELAEKLVALHASASRRAEIHLRLARATVAATRWELADRHLTQARTLAGDGGDAGLLARIDAVAAEVALGLRQPVEAAALARSALEGAETADLPGVACEALEILGRCARLHDLGEAHRAFARAEAVAAGHHLTLRRIRALHELATIDLLSANAAKRLVQVRELAAAAGALAVTATLDIQLAGVHYGAFEPDRVLEAAARAVETARRFRLDLVLPMALLWQASGHALKGERQAMEAGISEALVLAGDDPDTSAMAWGWCRAMCSLLEDDRETAAAHLERAVGYLRVAPAVNPWGFRGLWGLLRAVEDRDGATAWEEVREAGATVYWMNRGYVAHAEAVTVGRRGDTEAAQALFSQADEALAVSGWFQHHARCLVAEAAIANGWGNPTTWLREGAVFFEELGQTALASRCRSLLRQAGAPLPRKGRGDSPVPAPLRALGITSREMDVLRLIAQRMGNKEIGARLYLSPRTVEKHVASLIAKAAVHDRLELTRFAAAHLDPGYPAG